MNARSRPSPSGPIPTPWVRSTDLYELTMMAGYYASGMADRRATFELVRAEDAGEPGAYLVFAGLEQAIGDLLRLAFSPEQIEAIRGWPHVQRAGSPRSSRGWPRSRFEGDVWSVPEGTVVFPGETLVRVTALSAAGAVGGNASAGVAVVSDPGGVESGPDRHGGRRAAAVRVRCAPRTRAACRDAGGPRGLHRRLRGDQPCRGRRRLGIPAVGTMAHSWVQSFATESEAFERLRRSSRETRRCWSTRTTRSKAYATGRGDRAAGPGHPDR